MNRQCGFRDNNDAEKYFTHNIIADTLNILGIRPININDSNENRDKNDSLQINLEENELDRPRGGYKLIFPLKKNVKKYEKFFGNIIPKEDQELWKYLIE